MINADKPPLFRHSEAGCAFFHAPHAADAAQMILWKQTERKNKKTMKKPILKIICFILSLFASACSTAAVHENTPAPSPEHVHNFTKADCENPPYAPNADWRINPRFVIPLRSESVQDADRSSIRNIWKNCARIFLR
jgi:hypothetical protein